MNIVRNIRT